MTEPTSIAQSQLPSCDVTPANPDLEQRNLKEALEELEACLESPVVPGELPSWSAELQQACVATRKKLAREVKESHAEQLAKLGSKDPDLLNRVTQLKAEDEEIQAQFEKFEGMVKRMCERADIAEPHERKADEGLATLVDEGLALVIRIRKQERALAVWFAEAFQRDTGVGD